LSGMKSEFRKQIRTQISALTVDDIKASDAAITERFLSLPEVAECKASNGRIFAYASYGREVSTLAILSHFRKSQQYVYICWDWPPDVLPSKNDIIIVPGLTFDKDGYRMGKGGGYYDRLLSSNSDAFTVGLARDALLVDAVPLEPHDMRVKCLVTETLCKRF